VFESSLTPSCDCFPNPCFHLPSRLPSRMNSTRKYLNFSTCCSIFPLTCNTHWFGYLDWHNTSVFLVLISILAWSQASENGWSACWRPWWEDASSNKSSTNNKRLICNSQFSDPRRLGCDCLSSSIHVDYEEEWLVDNSTLVNCILDFFVVRSADLRTANAKKSRLSSEAVPCRLLSVQWLLASFTSLFPQKGYFFAIIRHTESFPSVYPSSRFKWLLY